MDKLEQMRTASGEMVEVLFSKLDVPPTDNRRETMVLPAGTVTEQGDIPLTCDILLERNVPVKMRDGALMYTDIYRPANATEPVPAIVSWSPYGKQYLGDFKPVPLSGLQKFEGPDPAFWVQNGYAVLNTDSRGIGNADGDFYQWGITQTEDGYDFVQWAGEQEWCNGKVTFAGTSYLAISQWFIAAARPSSLACIAPWEGFSNVYEHSICAGGIPDYEFEKNIATRLLPGHHFAENMGVMAERYPLWSAYWADKTADVTKIEVPVYAVASYTNKVHTRGTLDTFLHLKVKEKWLRIHNTHEWYDFYTYSEDLLKFYDHYMKGIDNGWEQTPPVRMAVLNPGGEDMIERPAEAYPDFAALEQVFYLDGENGTMETTCPEKAAEVTYTSEETDPGVTFTLTFDRQTEIVGTMHLKLWLCSEIAKDADLFLMAKKLDADGVELPVLIEGAPYCAPGQKAPFEWGNGRQRVSARHSFAEPEGIIPGEPVEADVKLCPMGMLFEAGQKLQLTLTPYNPAIPELPGMPPIKTVNQGSYTILTGENYPSALYLPILK